MKNDKMHTVTVNDDVDSLRDTDFMADLLAYIRTLTTYDNLRITPVYNDGHYSYTGISVDLPECETRIFSTVLMETLDKYQV